MGKKRAKPEQTKEEEEINYSEESLNDSEEEDEAITFKPLTKEERKKQEEMLKENEEEEEDSEGESEDDDDGIINLDIEFSDPKEAHFKSIRNLMRYMLLGAAKDVNFSPLADAVVKQVEAGSIVEINGEEDAYAFLTMLNLKTHKVLFCKGMS